ncbi:hypothetical protein VTO42DRAFT_2439 [Malbranchea cinnamomea]
MQAELSLSCRGRHAIRDVSSKREQRGRQVDAMGGLGRERIDATRSEGWMESGGRSEWQEQCGGKGKSWRTASRAGVFIDCYEEKKKKKKKDRHNPECSKTKSHPQTTSSRGCGEVGEFGAKELCGGPKKKSNPTFTHHLTFSFFPTNNPLGGRRLSDETTRPFSTSVNPKSEHSDCLDIPCPPQICHPRFPVFALLRVTVYDGAQRAVRPAAEVISVDSADPVNLRSPPSYSPCSSSSDPSDSVRCLRRTLECGYQCDIPASSWWQNCPGPSSICAVCAARRGSDLHGSE